MPPLPAAFLKRPLAHRALHDAANGVIENSPSAIRRAVDAGYGIEVDVQLSRDNVAMVFHDAKLDRLTAAHGLVAERSAAELSTLQLTGSSDRIPTLAAVLAMIDGQVPLLIEIKDQSGGLGAIEPALERAVATDLKGYAGPVAVMSFNPFVVAAMADAAPDVPRGLVTSGFDPVKWPDLSPDARGALREMKAFDQVGASFISHDSSDLGSPRVAALKASGVPILCWTITSAEAEAEARRVADNVTFEGYLPPISDP